MAIVTTQTFSQDHILDKLVKYFNGLSPAKRTIKAGDMPLFRIQVSSDTEELTVVTGTTPTVDPSAYVGEAVFTWVGARDTPTVATTSSFFELSKHVNNVTNIRHFTATAIGPVTEPIMVPDLPTVGPARFGYYLTVHGSASTPTLGWNGGQVFFEINDVSYAFNLPTNTTIEGEFGANFGDTVVISYNGPPGRASVRMRQFPEGSSYSGPGSFDVYHSIGIYDAERRGQITSFVVENSD